MRNWKIYSVAIIVLSTGCGDVKVKKDRESSEETERLRVELATSETERENVKKAASDAEAARNVLANKLVIAENEKIGAFSAVKVSATESKNTESKLATAEVALGVAVNTANSSTAAQKAAENLLKASEAQRAEVEKKALVASEEAGRLLTATELAKSAAEEKARGAESARADAARKLNDAEMAATNAEASAKGALKRVSDIETAIKDATHNPNFNLADANSLASLKDLLTTNHPDELKIALRKKLGLDGAASESQIIAKIAEALADKKKAIQVFMENPAPETVFAMDTDDVSAAYKLSQNEECLMIFNIDQGVDIVPISLRNKLPVLRGYEVIPIRASYQKVAVCKKDGKVQFQLEKGALYKLVSLNNDSMHLLITSREQGGCDSFAPEIKDKDLFANTYQTLATYRGEIDGVESIDLIRVTGGANRFSMGSAVFSLGATNCLDVISNGNSTELAVLACKVALGVAVESPQVKSGCFNEQNHEGLHLTFNVKV